MEFKKTKLLNSETQKMIIFRKIHFGRNQKDINKSF